MDVWENPSFLNTQTSLSDSRAAVNVVEVISHPHSDAGFKLQQVVLTMSVSKSFGKLPWDWLIRYLHFFYVITTFD